MFELADKKTVQRRLREQLGKARKLLAKAKARANAGPTAFRSYADEVIEYDELVQVLARTLIAAKAPGTTVDVMFEAAFHRLVCVAESRHPDLPGGKAWALVAQLLKKNSVYA